MWDEWAVPHDRQTVPFRSVGRRDVPLVKDILLETEAEHRAAHLEFQANQAAQLVAWLHVATRTFDRFVPTAERLGSDWWIPVTALVKMAIAAGKTEPTRRCFFAPLAACRLHATLHA